MVKRSKKVVGGNREKLSLVNSETLKYWGKYKNDMIVRELSDLTIYNYQNDLENWWLYIYEHQNNKSVLEIDDDDIMAFLSYCKQQGNNSRRMKRRIASISSFYNFLVKRRYMTENPTTFLERPRKDTEVVMQTFLTEKQIESMKEKLIQNIEDNKRIAGKHTAYQMRLYALFSLSTMARVAAVRSIRWEMVDFESRIVSGVIEKEGYEVELYFSEEVRDAMNDLIAFRKQHGINDNGYVFTAKENGINDCASVTTLARWAKFIGEMINVPTLHPHDFRHSGATFLKNKGMPLEDISELLHHAGTDVTRKFYIKADQRKITEKKDKYGL